MKRDMKREEERENEGDEVVGCEGLGGYVRVSESDSKFAGWSFAVGSGPQHPNSKSEHSQSVSLFFLFTFPFLFVCSFVCI
jgi:hypothetical protein